jgi:hypothetical protein
LIKSWVQGHFWLCSCINWCFIHLDTDSPMFWSRSASIARIHGVKFLERKTDFILFRRTVRVSHS